MKISEINPHFNNVSLYKKDPLTIIPDLNLEEINCPVCYSNLFDTEAGYSKDDVFILKTRKIRLNLTTNQLQIFCSHHKGYVPFPDVVVQKICEIINKSKRYRKFNRRRLLDEKIKTEENSE